MTFTEKPNDISKTSTFLSKVISSKLNALLEYRLQPVNATEKENFFESCKILVQSTLHFAVVSEPRSARVLFRF